MGEVCTGGAAEHLSRGRAATLARKQQESGLDYLDPETIRAMAGVFYCGDNLEVLNEYVPDESVDLIYLDPPFNSKRTFNIVYKDSRAQEEAFKDHWSWEEAAATYSRFVVSPDAPPRLKTLLRALHDLLIDDDSDLLAYITMMAPRLLALYRVLKRDGSLYLHCDPTASHYLKLLLDALFGSGLFFSEISWRRYGAHGDAKRYGADHDSVLYYGKSHDSKFNKQFVPYTDEYAAHRFRLVDESGRHYQEQNLSSPNPRPNLYYPYKASNGVTYYPHQNGWKCEPERMKQLDEEGRLHFPKSPTGRLRLKMFLDESDGVPVQDVWTDITLPSSSKERLGYPTQKPLDLLKRIVLSSSNPGDLVLDPFCGCGTAIEASESLGRRWIGIDVAAKAVEVTEQRFVRADLAKPEIVWHPADLDAALALAARAPKQFEMWALRKVRAARRRSKDRGIDGEAMFRERGGKTHHVVVSVKGGKSLNPGMVRDLRGTVEREKSSIGIFLTMHEPSKEMRLEASRAGYLAESDAEGPIPRLQIVTIERVFSTLPSIRCPGENRTEMPARVVPERSEQLTLGGFDSAIKQARVPKKRKPAKAKPKLATPTSEVPQAKSHTPVVRTAKANRVGPQVTKQRPARASKRSKKAASGRA